MQVRLPLRHPRLWYCLNVLPVLVINLPCTPRNACTILIYVVGGESLGVPLCSLRRQQERRELYCKWARRIEEGLYCFRWRKEKKKTGVEHAPRVNEIPHPPKHRVLRSYQALASLAADAACAPAVPGTGRAGAGRQTVRGFRTRHGPIRFFLN